MIPENAELQWFRSLQQDEEAALRYFFKNYFPAVRRYVCTMVINEKDAEEISSSAFLKLWEERATLKSVLHLVNRLYLIAKRDAIDHLRKQQSLNQRQQKWLELHQEEEQEDGAEVRDREILRAMALQAAYRRGASLPPACKKVFELHYQDGKTISAIAELLQISPHTVTNQLNKARDILRNAVKEKKLLE